MEKEFVPYELSLKMKELGFNEECFGSYYLAKDENYQEGKFDYRGELNIEYSIYKENTYYILAPTYSQTFRWFREKYQIFPEVLTDCTTEPKFVYTYNTFYGNPKDLTEQEWGWENNIGQYSDIYRTYEDAELECLKKLIEIVENKE
jgi:hypothetical protein